MWATIAFHGSFLNGGDVNLRSGDVEDERVLVDEGDVDVHAGVGVPPFQVHLIAEDHEAVDLLAGLDGDVAAQRRHLVFVKGRVGDEELVEVGIGYAGGVVGCAGEAGDGRHIVEIERDFGDVLDADVDEDEDFIEDVALAADAAGGGGRVEVLVNGIEVHAEQLP